MNSNSKNQTVAQIICESQGKVLKFHQEAVLFGLGVNDPKRVFGTTTNLMEQFGDNRVFETPTAENSSLGIALGLAISGHKPIVVYQRMDFFLLAMDQLVNGAAKWRYMFGDKYNTSMIIRLIVGRGWGQGPTHSQNLHSLFAHIPNLKVFFPSFAEDFEAIFENAFYQNYPVIVIEDRWIHQTLATIGNSRNKIEFGAARVICEGNRLSLITFGFNTILALRVVELYAKHDLQIELIDLVSLKPIDKNALIKSVKKTKKAVIVDSGFEVASIANYISDFINLELFGELESPIRSISMGDYAEPTSHGVISQAKIDGVKIAELVQDMLDIKDKLDFSELLISLVDVPDYSFKGPF